MSNKRRIIIIMLSVGAGTILSYFMIKLRRGGQELTVTDKNTLIWNLAISITLILGVGFMFLWHKKKDL